MNQKDAHTILTQRYSLNGHRYLGEVSLQLRGTTLKVPKSGQFMIADHKTTVELAAKLLGTVPALSIESEIKANDGLVRLLAAANFKTPPSDDTLSKLSDSAWNVHLIWDEGDKDWFFIDREGATALIPGDHGGNNPLDEGKAREWLMSQGYAVIETDQASS